MSKHTPGPWEWDRRGPTLRSVKMGKEWDEYWGPFENAVGKRGYMPPNPTVLDAGIEVSEYDAMLIAAAPDLLETLKAMSGAVYEQPIGVWFHAINAAIAKATGQGSGA